MTDWLRTRDVCALLQVQPNFVARLKAEGLPWAKVGGVIWFSRDAVDAFLTARTVKAEWTCGPKCGTTTCSECRTEDGDGQLRSRFALSQAQRRQVDRPAAGRQGRLPARHGDRPRRGTAAPAGPAEGAGPDDLAFPKGRGAGR